MKIIKLTESDLHNIIRSCVRHCINEGSAERRVAFDLRRGGGIDEPGRRIENIGDWKKEMDSYMSSENDKVQKQMDRENVAREKAIRKTRIQKIKDILYNIDYYVAYSKEKGEFYLCDTYRMAGRSKYPYFFSQNDFYFNDVNGLMEHLQKGYTELTEEEKIAIINECCGSIENLQKILDGIKPKDIWMV